MKNRFPDVVRDLLSKGLAVRFRATGHSMGSTIRHGDTITVAPICAADTKLGDIVLADVTQRFVAHRVVTITPDRLVLRGDAATAEPQTVCPRDVRARVVKVEQRSFLRRLLKRQA